MFVFVLVCIILCPFLFCNHLEERERQREREREREREMVALPLLSYGCLVAVNVL